MKPDWKSKQGDLVAAIAFLTRIPLPSGTTSGANIKSAWAWPVAGAAIGGAAGVMSIILLHIGVDPGLTAFAVLLCQILITGALHEDGLADSADGLFGGKDKESALAIMKDSTVGAFGALALCLSVGIRWYAILLIFESGSVLGPLIAVGAVSRAVMLGAMHTLPAARSAGLSAALGEPARQTFITGASVAAAIAILSVGWVAIPVMFAAVGFAFPICWIAYRRIGGQTGDILGAAQQCAEIGCLVLIASLIHAL